MITKYLARSHWAGMLGSMEAEKAKRCPLGSPLQVLVLCPNPLPKLNPACQPCRSYLVLSCTVPRPSDRVIGVWQCPAASWMLWIGCRSSRAASTLTHCLSLAPPSFSTTLLPAPSNTDNQTIGSAALREPRHWQSRQHGHHSKLALTQDTGLPSCSSGKLTQNSGL